MTEKRLPQRSATAALSARPALVTAAKTRLEQSQVPRIAPNGRTMFDHANYQHRCIAPAGSRPEQFHLNPEGFELIAHCLERFDSIRMIDADETWCADFVVVDQSVSYAICSLVHTIELPQRRSQALAEVPLGFEILPTKVDELGAWKIIRKSDGAPMSANPFWKRDDALLFLRNHASVRDAPKSSGKFGRPDDAE